MDLKFECPTCRTELTVDAAAAGQSFACPNEKCGAKVTVPVSQPTQSAGPPPPSKPSATIWWTGFSRTATIARYASSAFGRAL